MIPVYEKVPEIGTEPPLAKLTVIVNEPPVAAPVTVHDQVNELLPTVTAEGFVTAHVSGLPVTVIVALLTVVPALPELDKTTVQLPAVVQLADPVTLAPDVNDPNRPNTNPAMAMAAMRVIAMRMTVAMTGEIAFLPFTFVICMLNPDPSARLNKNCVSTISV